MKELLKRRYHEIVDKIYEDADHKMKEYARNMEIYYDAWRLRGDAPQLYRSGDYIECSGFIDYYERRAINDECPRPFQYPESSYLYYAYHFDPSVRCKGAEPDELLHKDDMDDLIQLIEQIQRAMQADIENRGICIETNPTSNVLIGPITRFDNHPLLRFYNLGLETEPSILEQSAQISVSINTDDQGVFDTKLENEYAVMASALERVKLPNGNKRYTSAQVYHWLDQIRQMGIEQRFNDNTNSNFTQNLY